MVSEPMELIKNIDTEKGVRKQEVGFRNRIIVIYVISGDEGFCLPAYVLCIDVMKHDVIC